MHPKTSWKHRVAHYADRIYLYGMVFVVGLNWAAEYAWEGLGYGVWMALIAIFTASFLEDRHHQGRLCEACAAEMPLNGPELAAQWDRQLRWNHWIRETPWRFLGVFVGALMGMALLNWTTSQLWGLTFFCAIMLTQYQYGRHHKKVQAWCRYCRWRGDDDDEEAPVAPPAPAVGA